MGPETDSIDDHNHSSQAQSFQDGWDTEYSNADTQPFAERLPDLDSEDDLTEEAPNHWVFDLGNGLVLNALDYFDQNGVKRSGLNPKENQDLWHLVTWLGNEGMLYLMRAFHAKTGREKIECLKQARDHAEGDLSKLPSLDPVDRSKLGPIGNITDYVRGTLKKTVPSPTTGNNKAFGGEEGRGPGRAQRRREMEAEAARMEKLTVAIEKLEGMKVPFAFSPVKPLFDPLYEVALTHSKLPINGMNTEVLYQNIKERLQRLSGQVCAAITTLLKKPLKKEIKENRMRIAVRSIFERNDVGITPSQVDTIVNAGMSHKHSTLFQKVIE